MMRLAISGERGIVPDRTHFVSLNPFDVEGDRIRVRIVTERGCLVGFAAQYEALIGERHHAIARYDCAHGRFHRDLLDRYGRNIEKKGYRGYSNDEALRFASRDFKANWRYYREQYMRRKDSHP